MELLAPAGNFEAFQAALACGADAVYLGYTAFGARSFAGNFDREALIAAVQYAHERGKRIYVTVNTLVKEKEFGNLRETLRTIAEAEADAVIVQDLGVAREVMAHFPELTMHASTQMTVNNAQGAAFLARLGFTRVVPARECDLAELERIAGQGIEVEAFAHGALCVSVSGQCLFSSMIGGRSGNRGKCAQPCRMPYHTEQGTRGYLLSPKDLMLLREIPSLVSAGVSSLKLEGRMKRPEYVAAITLAYREAIDAALEGRPYCPTTDTLDGILQVFNRGGFTRGYAMGEGHAGLMSWDRPNHAGLQVGKVVRLSGRTAMVELERDVDHGDVLQLRGKQDHDFPHGGQDERAGGRIAVPVPEGYRPTVGEGVFRMTSSRQMKALSEHLTGEWKRIPIDATLKLMPEQLPELIVQDEAGRMARARGSQPVLVARSQPLSLESARKSLGKMGQTPYTLRHLTLEGEGGFLPVAALNQLRRDALERLRTQRLADARPSPRMYSIPQAPECELRARRLFVRCRDLEEAETLLDAGADAFIWQIPSLIPSELDRAMRATPGVPIALELPAVTYTQELDALVQFARAHADRLIAVQVNNLGQLAVSWPCPVWGGQGLNLMNRACMNFYRAANVERFMLSCELTAGEMRDLDLNGEAMIEVYGRTQLMTLSHCPVRTAKGDARGDGACRACETQGGRPAVYIDRKGYAFAAERIRAARGCNLRLFNAVPTDMAKHAALLGGLPTSYVLFFHDESQERRLEITRSYRHFLGQGSFTHQAQKEATGGHLLRGVE